jgi:predicted NBD/HSP70 family sugar kinase
MQQSAFVAAVDFGGSKVAVGSATLEGELLDHTRFDTQAPRGAEQAVRLERVAVGNDVKAAGLAEFRWGALAGADPALFGSLGTGVAAAVLVGGRVLVGAHGAAGARQ